MQEARHITTDSTTLRSALCQAAARVYLLALSVAVLLTATGCSDKIDTAYGERTGSATYSVNGTAVLGEMFEQAGHEVASWPWLSPRLRDRADCIVWFPDDFEPPKEETRDWLEEWLLWGPQDTHANWRLAERPRTLIYVARDFDAAVAYWDQIGPGAPPEEAKRIKKAATEARITFKSDRMAMPKDEDCDWFTAKSQYKSRKVRTLSGPWAEGIDASKVEIELAGRIEPAPDAELLLHSQGDMLVARQQWDEHQLIVVANGSFLLNFPLVNHEHRKLAGKLIEQIGQPGQEVVFLESGQGGPTIREEDPVLETPTGMEIFFHFPSGWILWHFAAIGILLCFSRWPIFGIPRQPKPDPQSDFGKHIAALAELLKRAGDHEHARRRLAFYRQTIRGND